MVGKLTALKVARLTEWGMHADGVGLYLQITGSGAKSWISVFHFRERFTRWDWARFRR